MDWNPNYRYKLLGKLIRSDGELLFIFDLNNPEIFVRAVKEDGKIKTARKPVFPKEWQNQFGLPMEEHQKTMQVNIFDDYAVFGLQEEPKHPKKQVTISTTKESEVSINEQLNLNANSSFDSGDTRDSDTGSAGNFPASQPSTFSGY